MPLDAATLVAIGGREWSKDTMRRVYFNVAAVAGLEYRRSSTGGVADPTLHGRPISIESAQAHLNAFAVQKLWYDVAGDRWGSQGIPSPRQHEEYVARLLAIYQRRCDNLRKELTA